MIKKVSHLFRVIDQLEHLKLMRMLLGISHQIANALTPTVFAVELLVSV